MKSPRSIQDLVLKAQGGDREALSALFEEYRARLLTWIRLRLGQALRERIEAEDILQQTFLKALQSIGKFRWQGEGSLFAWLSGIAANLVLDLGDPRRRNPPAPLGGEVPAEGVPPSKALRREERFDRLREAIEGLSPQHREVILLARIEGLPLKEIAKRLDRSPNAVTQLLWRALQKLRASFGETESLHLPPRSLGGAEGAGDGR